MNKIVLASASETRAEMLRRANVGIFIEAPRVDEESIKSSMISEGADPRDIADTLAEAKARKVAGKHAAELVLGCDQVLAMKDRVFTKPESIRHAKDQLRELRGQTHHLFSAAVIYEDNEPVWRHIGQVRLTMRDVSDAYIDDYVDRNWESIRWSVGSYKLEEEGVRLFSRIDGNYFDVLGMPLLELLSYLTLRGTLPG